MFISTSGPFTFAIHALAQITPSLPEYPKEDLFLMLGKVSRFYRFIKYQKSPWSHQYFL